MRYYLFGLGNGITLVLIGLTLWDHFTNGNLVAFTILWLVITFFHSFMLYVDNL